MAKKTVQVATWEYRDGKGRRRRAYYGDVVDLSVAEVKRAKAAGVLGDFDKPAQKPAPRRSPAAPAAEADPVLPESLADDETDDLDGLDAGTPTSDDGVPAADGEVERPKQVAPKSAWVEYAVSTGLDREDAEEMDKHDLIQALK